MKFLTKQNIQRAIPLGFGMAITYLLSLSAWVHYSFTKTQGYADADLSTLTKVDLLISLTAFFVLLAAGRNFVFSIVTSLQESSKTNAIKRIFGASRRDLFVENIKIGCFVFAISLLVACGVFIPVKETMLCFQSFGYDDITTTSGFTILFSILSIVLVSVTIVPAIIHCRQSSKLSTRGTGVAFGTNITAPQNRRKWRGGIIFMQLLMCCTLIGLAFSVMFEYQYLLENPELTHFEPYDVYIFGENIMVGCFTTIIITLYGTAGYIRGELIRRSKEIAIRRICGSSKRQVFQLLTRDVLITIIPSVICGYYLSYFILSYFFGTMMPVGQNVPFHTFLSVLIVSLIIILVFFLEVRMLQRGRVVELLKYE